MKYAGTNPAPSPPSLLINFRRINQYYIETRMKKIECIIMDWAGTAVDYGCFAPVAAFIEAFAEKDW